MSSPITWRNVEAPDLRGAAIMMGQAQAGINSGFDRINEVLKAERATADANWNVIRDNNTQAFLDSVNQYRTAEEFQAAQKAGALERLRSQFGNQVDRSAIRAAEDGRLATLQGRDVQAINYGNTMTDAKEDPIKRAAMVAILNKDTAGLTKILAENPNMRALPEILGKRRDITQQNVEWERAGTKSIRESEKHDSDMLTAGLQRKVLDAQANRLNAEASADVIAARLARAAGGGSGSGGGSLGSYSPEAAKAFVEGTAYAGGTLKAPKGGGVSGFDEIKKLIPDESDRNKVMRTLSEMGDTFKFPVTGKDGKVVEESFPIPLSVVLNNIPKSYGHGLFGVGRGHYARALRSAIEEDIKANAGKYADDYKAVQQVMGNAQNPSLLIQAARAQRVAELSDQLPPEALIAATSKAQKKTR